MMHHRNRDRAGGVAVAILILLASVSAAGGELTENGTAPFGRFKGVDYVRHTGRFVGTTSRGQFRVPYELIAPADPARSSGTLLFEPPHFLSGPTAPDILLGPELLFGTGMSYATVGFGNSGLNILDPGAGDAVLAGVLVSTTGSPPPPIAIVDEEILIQFVNALSADPVAMDALGMVRRTYAYGISQSAAAVLEMLYNFGGTELFDLVLLHTALWRPPFDPPGLPGGFDLLDGDFEPVPGSGKVIFVAAEGDQLLGDSEQFRKAAFLPNYRLYEVAGAAHAPSSSNPLEHAMIVRAMFVAGDRWVRRHVPPPPSHLLARTDQDPDPVYPDRFTGIARDADGNALGGVRLPDVAVGRAQFIAADFSVEPLPGLSGVFGAMVDLTCEPRPGSESAQPRFDSHGQYVRLIARTLHRLVWRRFLLPGDASALLRAAAKADVGKPGTCGS